MSERTEATTETDVVEDITDVDESSDVQEDANVVESTDVESTDVEDTDVEEDAGVEDGGVEDGGVEDGGVEESAGEGRRTLQARLEEEGDVAADYLEELLDIADLDGDLDMDVEGERAMVSIVGADLSQLVGARGEVLEALQELTRLAVYRETGERSRLMLDISGHRAARRLELEELAGTTVAQVKESGEQAALRPMTPFERKVVHDAVAAAGLTSESEGVEPRRYVVILPA